MWQEGPEQLTHAYGQNGALDGNLIWMYYVSWAANLTKSEMFGIRGTALIALLDSRVGCISIRRDTPYELWHVITNNVAFWQV